MHEQIHNKLGAYLDGELNERSRLEVQAHLATCQLCREELGSLRQLSEQLHAIPTPDFMPANRFAAQLLLQLPRQKVAPQLRPRFQLAGWMAPAAILIVWLITQAISSLSAAVSIANHLGLTGEATAWLDSRQPLTWITATQTVFGGLLNADGQAGLNSVSEWSVLFQRLAAPFVWQIALAVLYWAALALWWQSRQTRQSAEAAR